MRLVRPCGLALLALALTHGCAALAPSPRSPHRFDVERAAARLTLPPDAASRIALGDLRAEAQGGDQAARLARAVYLLDLFDHARFAAAPASRKLLFEELSGSAAAPGGELATEWAAQQIDAEFARARAAGPDAAAGRALLAVELAAPGADQVRLLAPTKRIARDGRSALRANAILRLYGFCARALRDACQAPRPEGPAIANHCLYALYNSDPAAYFSDDPQRRPPDPPWTAYRDGLSRLLEELARTGARLAPLAKRLEETDQGFFASIVPTALPLPLDVAALRLPEDRSAPLWDRTPLVQLTADGVTLGGPYIDDAARLRTALAAFVSGDPRRTLAVVAAQDVPASQVIGLAEAAAAAGIRVLELGVAQPVTLKAPPGDFWAGRTAARLGVLPVALTPLGGGAPPPRDDPRAALWDPARDELGLSLLVDDGFVLAGRGGLVARLPASLVALRAALVRVQRAFPDQSALAIAVGQDTSYGDLVATIGVVLRDERGAPLFPALALQKTAPRPRGSLEALVARRAAADVAIAVDGPPLVAQVFAPLGPQLRRCYLDALERLRAARAQLVFDLSVNAQRQVTLKTGAGPRDAKLRTCLRERLARAADGGFPGAALPTQAHITLELGPSAH